MLPTCPRIADHTYDFILSSHNLEHFANPVKALQEWKRVTRPGGGLILVLPDYSKTFDHRRTPTTVDHMFEDFERDTQEDDLTHLPEILEKHDISLDPGVASADEFHRRSLDNFNNRCLHHHVFDESKQPRTSHPVRDGSACRGIGAPLPYLPAGTHSVGWRGRVYSSQSYYLNSLYCHS